MKKILILLTLVNAYLPSTFAADDDLFQIASGKEEVQGGTMSPSGIIFLDPTAPSSGDVSAYVNWVNSRIESGKKHWMAYLASQVGHKISTKCLWNKEAFQFRKIGTDKLFGEQYEVACLAGPAEKTITHVLKFKMNVKTIPDGCVGQDAMTKFFTIASNRTADAATNYGHGIINSLCKISVVHADMSRGKVIQSAQLLNADDVKKILQSDSHKELRELVKNSKAKAEEESDVRNPMKAD